MFSKKLDKETQAKLKKTATANEFVNVSDVKGNILYSKDGYIFAYIKIYPISLELLTTQEKLQKIRMFSTEFATERKNIKFFSISRPVDITILTNILQQRLQETNEIVTKQLLKAEMNEINNFATSGEVIERNFHLIIYEKCAENAEMELIKRAKEIVQKFQVCGINSTIASESMIISLCNLFANPAYAHFEGTDVSQCVPFIGGNI